MVYCFGCFTNGIYFKVRKDQVLRVGWFRKFIKQMECQIGIAKAAPLRKFIKICDIIILAWLRTFMVQIGLMNFIYLLLFAFYYSMFFSHCCCAGCSCCCRDFSPLRYNSIPENQNIPLCCLVLNTAVI